MLLFCIIPTVRDVIKSHLKQLFKRSNFGDIRDASQLYPDVVTTSKFHNLALTSAICFCVSCDTTWSGAVGQIQPYFETVN